MPIQFILGRFRKWFEFDPINFAVAVDPIAVTVLFQFAIIYRIRFVTKQLKNSQPLHFDFSDASWIWKSS